MERTLAIFKPDAVEARVTGKLLARIEQEEFRVVALRRLRLTRAQAEGFYAVHRERPFFRDLTTFMSSGPVVVLVLEAPGAIARWREVMGATRPTDAAPHTLRKEFGTSVERNACHGSDAPETAAVEIAYFFAGVDLLD
jgi:nucleoside-diphosphate kinase